MRINYNVSAMLSNNALANNDSLLSKSLERLSSGLKINKAKDNPSGLAMAKRMNAQLVGLDMANENASDGISVIETADGALAEVSDMLQRMNELSVKAANGTMTDEDRDVIQGEIEQLKEEITRISETTEFNGKALLNGEFELKGYTNSAQFKVNSYSKYVPVQEYTIDSLTVEKEIVQVTEVIDGVETTVQKETGYYTATNVVMGENFPEGLNVSTTDGLLTFTGANNFELTIDLNEAAEGTFSNLKIDVLGIGAMRLQIGANEGQVLAVEIPAVTLQNMSIDRIDVSTKEGADDAIGRIDDAIKYLSDVRGRLGAYQNRLESSVDSLDITSENMTAAYSRIMDVDMAEEMTQYTTAQVLTQAGTSMLAQANERPSQILQLLQ